MTIYRTLRSNMALIFLGLITSSLAITACQSAPRKVAKDLMANIPFRNIGPGGAGERVSAVAGVPGNPHIYYIGAASGGVFKTTNGGNTWKAVFEHQGSGSIGAIALDPSNPDHVWIGTGESSVRNSVVPGDGIYYSDDGGASWTHMGLKNVGHIARILIDPTDSDIVYVAAIGNPWHPNAARGLYKTENGGQSWRKVLYLNKTTGAADVIMQPGHPNKLLVAMWQYQRHPPWIVRPDDSKSHGYRFGLMPPGAGHSGGAKSGIYRSLDGGDTWSRMRKGLPTGNVGRIGLAVAPSEPDRVYAIIESEHGVLWRSDNYGSSWKLVSSSRRLNIRPYYFSRLAVAPDNPNDVFFMAYKLLESTDGGKTTHWADLGVHDDHHALWIDPTNPQRLIQGNDGGVYVSYDGAQTWRQLDNLPIAQFYQVDIDDSSALHACGGLQDLGVWYGPTTNLGRDAITGQNWYMVNGGDGAYCVIAPTDPNIIYTDTSGGGHVIRYNVKTHVSTLITPPSSPPSKERASKLKYRFGWISPIAVSPSDENNVFMGGNVVFESHDGGFSWDVISPDLTRIEASKGSAQQNISRRAITGPETNGTISSLSLASKDADVIWVGTDNGLVQVTKDGGRQWHNVTPPDAPEGAEVYQIGISAFNAGVAYIPFDAHKLGDNSPYAYKTRDYGRHWQKITADLPANGYINVIREDPFARNLLVLGSNLGLYYSLNDGNSWHHFSAFPTVNVRDVKFSKDHDLVVASHGRGIFVLDDLRSLEQLDATVRNENFHLFNSGPGIEFYHWHYDQRWQTDYVAYRAPNPPDGVYIDYYYNSVSDQDQGNSNASKEISVEITGQDGSLIREFKAPAPRLGINRIVWDMRYNDSSTLRFQKSPPPGPGPGEGKDANPHRGPLVPPGKYHVKIQYQNSSQEVDVVVMADPKLSYPSKVYEQYAQYALRARNMVNSINTLVSNLFQVERGCGRVKKDPTAIKTKSSLDIKLKRQSACTIAIKLFGKVYNKNIPHDVIEGSYGYQTPFHSEIVRLARKLADEYPHKLRRPILDRITAYREELNRYIQNYNQKVAPAVRRAQGLPKVISKIQKVL